MKNSIKSTIYKLGVGASVLAWILLTSKDALAQNIASNQKNKAQTENNQAANSINIRNTNDPIGYAFNNIEKYYPDMQIKHPEVAQHLAKLRQQINWSWGKIATEEANKIFKSIQRSSSYSDGDIIRFIVGISECNVIQEWVLFSDTYRDEDYTPEEKTYYNFFKKAYTDRFNTYEKQFNENLTKLQQKIKDLEQSIKDKEQSIKGKEEIYNENIKDIMKMLDKFSIEDTKSNKMVYEAVKKTKENAKNLWRKTTLHAEDLFSIIK